MPRTARLTATLCLAFVAAACDGSTGLDFGPPANVAVTAGNNQSAPVGTAVAVNPAVKVTDAAGKPVVGLPVIFAVTSGGGTIGGGTPSTNDEGVATLGSWTLGTTAGEQTLTAAVPTLGPVTFTATATAGAAAAVTKHAGDAQTATAGAAVTTAPAVKVTDAHGNVVANVAVTFAVASGGGSVTGGSATTNAQGIATVGGWTLGAAGAQSLTATVAGVAPVTFTATAADPCASVTALTVGTAANGTIANTDCLSSSTYNDKYSFTVAAQTELMITVTPTTARIYQSLSTSAGQLVTARAGANAGAAQTSYFVLPAGSYTLEVGGMTATDLGAYTITTANAAPTTCGFSTGTRPGVTINGSITATDCLSTFGNNLRYDQYALYLQQGDKITGTLSTSSGATLEIYRDNALIAQQGANTGTRSVVFTAPATGYYYASVVFTTVGATGNYTLSLASGGDACAAAVPFTLGGWSSGLFTGDSCQSNGFATHTGTLSLGSTQTVLFGLSPNGSPAATPIRFRADIYRGSDFVIAWSLDNATTPESFKALLPAGDYSIRLRPVTAGETGGFSLATAATSQSGCESIITVAGISASGELTTSDCLSPITNNDYYDEYLVNLVAGRTYTFNASASGFLRIELWVNGQMVKFADSATGTPSFTFTPTGTGYFAFTVIGGSPKLTKSYTFSIQ